MSALALGSLLAGGWVLAETNTIGNLDGTFETSLPAGSATGDTRIVSNIGVVFPSQGSQALLMTTAPDTGSTPADAQSSSLVVSNFTIPAGYATIRLDYDFLTNEPAPSYANDTFEVKLILVTAGGEETLLASDTFNNNFTDAPWTGYNAQTGYRTMVGDISSIAGTGDAVSLELRIADVGDGRRDSAVLVDNVRLVEPGAPTAVLDQTYYHINAGDQIVFDASKSVDDKGITSYEWSFGNGYFGYGPVIAMDQYTQPGFYNGTLKVTDADGHTDTRPFTVSVGPIDTAPKITSSPNVTASEGVQYSYQVVVADNEIKYGDIMTYSLTTAPSGMTIDPSSGLISWAVPIGGDLQTNVTVKVTDSQGQSDTQSFKVTLGPEVYIATVSDDSRIYTARSLGDGTFESLKYLDDIGNNSRGIVIADFDGDDDFDMITGYVDGGQQHLYLYKRQGGGFSTPIYLGELGGNGYPVGSYVEDMAAADFTNNGRMDFIANTDDSNVWLMANTGPLVTTQEDFFASDFETDDGGWGTPNEATYARDDTTSYTGSWSMHVVPSNTASMLSLRVSPSNWYMARGSTMKFAYRIAPGTPVGLLFNVSGLGWIQVGGSPKADPGSYPVSPKAVSLVDDGAWHTVEFDLYSAIRAYWPTASFVSNFEWWTNNNASNAAGNEFWFDDFHISRPRMVSGFAAKLLPTNGGNGRGLDAADVNLDGNVDFIRARYSSGYEDLYVGDGHGNFTLSPTQVADSGTDPYGVALGDFDGNGTPDLIANGGGGGDPYFFSGVGNGTFNTGVYIPTLDTNNYTSYGAFDFNGDGKMDMVTSDYTSRTVQYRPGKGDGTFGAATTIGTTTSPAVNILAIATPAGRFIGQPFAKATADKSVINEGGTINFDASASYDDGNIADYSWNFGDGTTGDGVTISHVYPKEGNYDVVLTVVDNDGNLDRFNLQVHVKGTPPVANAGGPYVFGEDKALKGHWHGTLDGRESSDAETSVARYEWDFDASDGIGVDSTGPLARPTYKAPGTYTVTLTVYDEVGQSATTTTTVTTLVGTPPVASLAGPTTLGEAAASLGLWTGVYGASATTDDYGIDTWQIDWADGSTSSLSPMSDDFDDGNLSGWSFYNGSWNVINGEAAQTALGSGWRWMQDRNRTYKDFQLEFDFKANETPTDGYMGIVFRNDNGAGSTNSFLLYSRNSWGFWRFYDWKTATTLADGGTGWDPNIWYHIRLVVVGDSLKLYVTPQGGTETLQLETTSTAHPIGGIGLLANDQDLRYDNVKVTPLDAEWKEGGLTIDDFVHSFNAAQNYAVTLTATDHAGQASAAVVNTSVEKGAPPVANAGGPYTLNEADAKDSRWNFIMDASGSTDDNHIQRYTVDFGDGTSYTTGFSNGRRGSYFATGTDLYGYDTPNANLQRIIATEDNTLVEIFNLATNEVVASNTLNRFQTWNTGSPGDGIYYKVKATKPVAAYFTNLSPHSAFMPSMDGDPVGNEFIFHEDNNNGFYIYAFEDAQVSFYETNGTLSQRFFLHAGEYATSTDSENVKHVVSTGRIDMQTNGYNAYTTVPSSNGDGAGRLFYFATDNWSTGAIAVFAHQPADIQVFDMDTGALLYTASVAAGQMWYQNGVGTRRLRLVSTGDVEVWAGDTEGGTGILNLGDDISFAGGSNGTDFVLHNLAGGIVIFAPNNNTEVTVDGAVVTTLNLDGYLPLAPTDFATGSGVHTIHTSQPVVIETLGQANGFNDLGTYLGGVSMRHQYLATGTYPLTLTVTDNTGQTNTAQTTVTVMANDPPVAVITGPSTADESSASGGVWTVQFDAGSSSDDYGIASYHWDFGDGTTATGAKVSHGYTATGHYTVTLTVTDNAGQSTQATSAIDVVAGSGPTADVGGPYQFGEASASYGVWTATFDGTGSSDDSAIYDYLWSLPTQLADDFESGVIDPDVWTTGSNTTESGGVLTITGANNWTSQGFVQAVGSPIQRVEGTTFTAQVQGTSGTMMFGMFGDAPEDFNYTRLHHALYFSNGGLYVYEDGNNRGKVGDYSYGTWYDVRIVLAAVGAEYDIRERGTTTWTHLYTSTSGSASLVEIGATVNGGTWNFDNVSTGPLLKKGPIVTAQFHKTGTYPVTLRVRDNALQADSDSTTFSIVDGTPPVANAGGPYTVEVGSLLNFNGTGSTDDNAIETYDWVFGDHTGGPTAPGSMTADLPYTGTGPTPRHFYKAPGTYDVQLTVTDNTLKTDVATTTVNVVVGNPPKAVVSVGGTPGAGGPPAYFDGRSSSDDYGIVEYRWDFDNKVDSDGDGDPTDDIDAVGTRPFHNYPLATYPLGTIFGDDFSGTALDSGVWASSGATQSGGTVQITGAGSWTNRYITSIQTFDRSRISVRGQIMQGTSGSANAMWGLKVPNTNASYTNMPHAIYFNSGNIYIYENGSNRGMVGTYTRGVQYDVRIDLKAAGADYYYRETGSPDWIPINPANPLNSTATPLQINATVAYGDTTFDNFTVEGRGPYVATLTVEDGAGQTSASQVNVSVGANEPPDVITVPWVAFDPLLAHETYNGKAIRLKGIVRDADPATFQWSFGDGTSSPVTNVTDKYDLSVFHTYPDAPAGTPFTATLTVTDSKGNKGSATYPVIVKPKNLTTEINVAIDEGLWYLHQTQTRSTADGYDIGYWTSNARASATASSIQAFQVNGHLESGNPAEDPYQETVMRGLRQVFRDLGTVDIGTQTYGEPDTNGNGIGVQTGVNNSGGYPIYQGGQVLDAIVSSGNPLAHAITGGPGIKGRSYFDIATDMVDQFAWGQTEQGSGGGWRYNWNTSIDNSAAQWGAIGLLAAEQTFGIPVPQWVKERNIVWLNNSYGKPGWGYQGGGASQAGTPSGLVQSILDGRTTNDAHWIQSEKWIADHWTSQYIVDSGNRPYYPYYALTKAMRLARPKPVETFYNGFDWFRDGTLGLARTLIDDQMSSGKFPGSVWITGELRSAWGVIILSRALFVQPPVADAGPDRVWAVDVPLQFDGSGSYHLDPFHSIVKYEWDFNGDGVYDYSSDQPYATHTYSSTDYPTLPVTINAKLRVTDNNVPALTDTDTVQIIIAVPPHPPVAVIGGPYTCTAGLTCQLDGSKSFDIDPTDFISRYEWDLDGYPFDYTGATGPKPTPIFAVGTYNIGLRVYDNGVLNDLNGDGKVEDNERLSDVAFTTVTAVENQAPIAKANGPYTVNEGSSIVLDSSGSYDPNGDPLQYSWDFNGDGKYDDGAGPSPSYLGVDDGTYTVGLKVTDTLLDGTATATVHVVNVPPTVSAGPDVTMDEGGTHTFSGSFTDPGTLDTHTIEWDFGDGTTATGTLTPSHEYDHNGSYTVTLKVTDDDGGVGTDSLVVTVNDLAPTARLTGDQNLQEGSTGAYDASGSTSSPDAIAGYEWDFNYNGTFNPSGDTGPTVNHVFQSGGSYTVAVRVTDSDGSTSIATLPVTVTNVNIAVSLGPNATIDEGQTFTRQGSFTDAGATGWTASVDYGDGTGPQTLPLNPDKTFDLSHTYLDNAVYSVSVTVQNNQGDSTTASVQVTVNDLAPTARLAGDQSLLEAGTGAYDASSSTSFPDAIAGYEWDFDYSGTFNPSGVTGPTATHLFPDNGNFTVAVRVTDDDGSTSIATLSVIVTNVAPVVDAGPDGAVDAGQSFTQTGSFTDPGSDSWTGKVDYGDGSGPQPLALNADKTFTLSHTYASAGGYTVIVTITDDDGGVGTDTAAVTVSQVAVSPTSPSDLTARAKSGEVQLVWTDIGADSYNVYRSLTSGGPYTFIANTTSTYSTYLDTGLTNGTTYYYVVTSVIGNVESSPPSNEAWATPSSRTR